MINFFPYFPLRHKSFSHIGFELIAFIHQYVWNIVCHLSHAGDTALTKTWSVLTVWCVDREIKWLKDEWEITQEGDTGRTLWAKGATTARLPGERTRGFQERKEAWCGWRVISQCTVFQCLMGPSVWFLLDLLQISFTSLMLSQTPIDLQNANLE